MPPEKKTVTSKSRGGTAASPASTSHAVVGREETLRPMAEYLRNTINAAVDELIFRGATDRKLSGARQSVCATSTHMRLLACLPATTIRRRRVRRLRGGVLPFSPAGAP